MKYVFLVLYVLMMVGVSYYSRSRAKTLDQFFLGGRNIGPWMSAFSYGTAYFSAVIFIGYAGRLGWNFGLAATWIGLGNAFIGNFLAWKVLAGKTREFTHRLGAKTMPEFVEKRYGSRNMKLVVATVIFIFLVPYSASVYQGLAYLFEKALGLRFEYCMVAMAIVTGLYLLVGGYIATSISDFIQGFIMLIGVGFLLFFVISSAGGITGGLTALNAIDPQLTSVTGPDVWLLISLVVMTSLGSWGLPQMVHKFYAIKDVASVKRATIISTIFALIIAGGAYFSGAFGRVILGNTMPAGGGDTIMPDILMRVMPDSLLGIIIILVLAASMSTLTSVVLVSSSSIAIDIVKGALVPNMSDAKVKGLMRLLCAVFIGLSLVIAFQKQAAILTLMSFSWGTVAGVTLAPYIYGLYWKGATRAGAWASIITGLSVSLLLGLVWGFNSGVSPKIGALAIVSSLVVMPIVSNFTKKFDKNHIKNVFGA